MSPGRFTALLVATLTCKAAAAVSVGPYSAWESTATLRVLGGAWAPVGDMGRSPVTYCVATRTYSLMYNLSLTVYICVLRWLTS